MIMSMDKEKGAEIAMELMKLIQSLENLMYDFYVVRTSPERFDRICDVMKTTYRNNYGFDRICDVMKTTYRNNYGEILKQREKKDG